MVTIPRVVIGAPASGHGTTTVATGLLAAFARRGLAVSSFEVGPPAAARRNLDPVLVGEELIGPLFAHGAAGTSLAVVEGARGLYDGRAGAGETGSTAQVAHLLDAPVILVVDAAAQGRSIAALVHGFRSFGHVRMAGVILNRVGSDRHEEVLREACEEAGTPVLGALRRADAVAVSGAQEPVDALASLIESSVDLAEIMAVARSAPPLDVTPWSPRAENPVTGRPVVALAGGPAYAETAELLHGAGVEVATVDPLRDEALPAGTRGLVVVGGFPEEHAADLSANEALRKAVADLAASGGKIVAEGAGLLWLCRAFDGAPMCGVIDAEASTTPTLTEGYRDAVALTDSPLAPAGTRVTGYEHHRTTVHPRSGLLLSPAGGAAWAWRGADPEGFATPTVQASYLHLSWAGNPGFATRLAAAL